MADPKRRWTGQCEYPLTDEYRAGHEATFGSKLDRYCQGCGRLPSWCECPGKWEDPCSPIKNVFIHSDGGGVGRIGINTSGETVRLPDPKVFAEVYDEGPRQRLANGTATAQDIAQGRGPMYVRKSTLEGKSCP